MRKGSAGVFAVVALLMAGGVAVAAKPPPAKVVATVGDLRITVSEMETRMRRTPLFQLKAMASDPDGARRKFLDRLVTEALLVKGAEEAKLHERHDVRERIRSVLTSALLGDLRREAQSPDAISDAQVRAYYEENRERYAAQKRVKIWQIVLGSKADAEAILEITKSDPEYLKDPVAGWDRLARERSLDKASAMRKGNLGFVQADGSTAHKSVQIPPEMFQAAAKIRDGQIYPEPMKVGDYWVVLQRRGGHDTPERTLEAEAATIRGILAKERMKDGADQLLKQLRAKHVSNENAAAVERIDITAQGQVTPMTRPGVLPRAARPAAGTLRPRGKPGDLR